MAGIMLTTYEFEKRPFISAAELFDQIFPTTRHKYAQWVRINITEQPQELPVKRRDYISFEEAGVKKPNRVKGGKKRQDFLISTMFGMELCYQAKTLPAREVRNFLYKFAH
jgi:hypothetical protein